MHKTDVNVILLESVNYFTRYFVKVHKIIAAEKICNSSSHISAKILSEATDPGGKSRCDLARNGWSAFGWIYN